jgi:cation:H+ antiporter
MTEPFSLFTLVGVFVIAAAAIWYAGIRLVDATDILDERWNLGEVLGGAILLAIATNLPELAITVSAAWSGNLGVVVGNILGGIAIQTTVLVVLDFSMREERPLTHRAASLVLVVEGIAVVAILSVCIMATQLPSSLIFDRVTPGPLFITAIWVVGVWLTGRANMGLPWQASAGNEPGSQPSSKEDAKSDLPAASARRSRGTAGVLWTFGWASAVTLVAGVVLERAGDVIADRIGMSGVLFGATVLAAATSLPELSTGLRAIAKRDYRLAISDIFGGNAFLPSLFLLATVVSGQAILPRADHSDIYLAGLAAVLTCVYMAGLIFRPSRRIARIGPDSLVVLILYVVGITGLIAIA